jgi:la-related protein 1
MSSVVDANVNSTVNPIETNPEVEQVEQFEQLDEETLKALKNAKFDLEYFSNKESSTGKNNKQKAPKENSNKKKGKDFESYAKENGLNYNLKYDTINEVKQVEKNTEEKKKPYQKNHYQYDMSKNPKFSGGQGNGYGNNTGNGYNQNYKKNKGGYNPGNNYINNRPMYQVSTNKFDPVYQPQGFGGYGNQYQQMMNVNPYRFDSNTNGQFQSNYSEGELNVNTAENEESGILTCLNFYFSIDNLNKDSYIRSKMDSNGNIDAGIVTNFNK